MPPKLAARERTKAGSKDLCSVILSVIQRYMQQHFCEMPDCTADHV